MTSESKKTRASKELAPHIDALKAKLNAPGERPAAAAVALADIDRQIAREAASALRSWCDSPEGKTARDSLAGYSLEELRLAIDQALQGPHFKSTLELTSKQRAMALDESSIPYQTISLGFMVEGDVGVGVYGSIGYAADLSDITGTSVIYLSGAILEGGEVGVAAGVQIGVWKDSTSDMEGYYNAQQVAILDGGGVIAWSYESSSSLKAIVVDIAVGLDDGVSEAEVYVVTFGIEHYPVYQEEKSHFLILTSLICNNTNETGHDEVLFFFVPDGGTQYRYPTWDSYSMADSEDDPDHQWNVGRSVYFDNSVAVSLYDSGGDQLCSTETLDLSDFNGANSTSQLSFEREGSLSNGWNEISYTMNATLVF